MAELKRVFLEAKAFLDGIKLRGLTESECAGYVLGIKQRFLKDKAAFEALADDSGTGHAEAARAAFDLLDIALNEVLHLSMHPRAASSPIAAEIASTLESIREKRREVLGLVPGAILNMDNAELINGILELFGLYEIIIVQQLPLVFREQVPDYFAGLDEQAPYPSYRCSASNRGKVKTTAGSGGELWSTKIGGLIWPSAVVDRNGDIYTGHADGEFVALHPDGSEKWRIFDKQMMYIDSTGALGKDGFLYMASTDYDPKGHQNQGRIWKIDPKDGSVVWTFWGRHFEDPETNPNAHLSSYFEGNISLNEENGEIFIYAGSDDNYLYKLDSGGSLVWEYDTETYPSGVIWTKPLISPDGETIFIGELSGQVHAVDARTGTRKWARRLGGSVVSSPAYGTRGELFLGCFDGKVYCLAPEDGNIFWSYQTLGLIYSSPAVTDCGDIVIGSSDGAVYRLDRYGKLVWRYYTDAPIKSSPAIDDKEQIYIGNQNGKLYCLGPGGRRVWSYQACPDIIDNDINSSPSLGADGTVYFGNTQGEVYAIPADYYFKNRTDGNLDLDPGHDGESPAIPPGGATLVFMDRHGMPVFDPPEDLPVHDNLNMKFFAVNENIEVIPAKLDPENIRVEISPELKVNVRVESMGRFLYIMPEELPGYDTDYTLKMSGTYTTVAGVKEFNTTLNIHTEKKPASKTMPLSIGKTGATGFVIHGITICQPKEIDALGQAMMDSQNFGFAPIYIDEEKGIVALAMAATVHSGGEFSYTPATVNRAIVGGSMREDCLKVSGSMRLIVQGANIPFDSFVMSGRIAKGPSVLNGNWYCITSAEGMPDFTELIRVMGLADSHDDVVGFCTFSSAPFESDALRNPGGTFSLSATSDLITAEIDIPGYREADHRAGIALIDKETGSVIDSNRVEVTSEGGIIRKVVSTIPVEAVGRAVAVLTLDLFAADKIEL
ncbi:MAG TPA: PQQ-binding-like beta-propeller repeat protein [bacterium]|nr:PQQ-binding-like beta-propeller repeat protein [bacterium]